MHSTDDEDVFNVDCKEWSNDKKVHLLHRKLGTTERSRFVDFIPAPPKNNGSGVLRDSYTIIWSIWAEHITFS